MTPPSCPRVVLPLTTVLVAVGAVLALPGDPSPQDKDELGYQDTPLIPGTSWHVHDGLRPQPRVVAPGTDGAPPSDAIVLFDGTHLDEWTGNGGEAKWKLVGDAMEVNGTGAIKTKEKFGDCQLHVEWASPAEVKGKSQGRGNSGVFLMEKYEIQVLDNFGNKTYPDGQAGSLYGQSPPLVNACREPGEWQSYDIVFRAPRFEDGALVSPAVVTLIHNGVVVHHAKEMLGATTHRNTAKYSPHGPEGAISLQDHGNPVRYRNIWVRRLADYDE